MRLQEEGAESFRQNTIQRIHDYIWAYESGSGTNNPVEAFRQFMASLDVDPELIKILSPENVRDLMQSIEKGEHVYEVLAHLESNEQVASDFLIWVESSGSKVVTNRSVFIDNQSWYEMLMVSPLAYAELDQKLSAIDPDKKYLQIKTNSSVTTTQDGAEILRKISSPQVKPQQKAAPASNVIRVSGEILDAFMNQIGEMVLSRSRLNHILNDNRIPLLISRLKRNEPIEHIEALTFLDTLEEHRRSLFETDTLIHSTLNRLQAGAMGLRVVPVETVFKRLPRLVRDLSQSLGKRIRLDISGQEVKIDKAMIETLVDPLLHMVKNSIDHGIETPEARREQGKNEEAYISISARQQGNNIILEISDDGKGIDSNRVLDKAIERGLAKEEDRQTLSPEEIFHFLFQPGFSTATVVTETSGRGVGLDVVMTNVMRLGGAITIHSEPGRGTDFHLQMPLSAAVQEVLMVEAAGQTLALPGRYVSEVLTLETDEVQSLRGERAILLRGTFLPLHSLPRLLGFQNQLQQATHKPLCLVVLTNGRQMIGIEVDRVIRRQELFTKDIQAAVAALPGVGGASILGNGRVVLILDGEELLKLAKTGRR
jgi:chemotaxis protein histidine kinase CheA